MDAGDGISVSSSEERIHRKQFGGAVHALSCRLADGEGEMEHDVEPTQLPANLLAPYLAAAIQEAANGSGLTPWSQRILDEAIAQISEERSEMQYSASDRAGLPAAALSATSTSSFEFAALALDAFQNSVGRAASAAEERDLKVGQLSELVTLLDRVGVGDVAAAQRALQWCDAMVGQLFGRLETVEV